MPCLNQGTEEAPPNIHTAVLILEISAAGLAGTFYEVTGVNLKFNVTIQNPLILTKLSPFFDQSLT